jgi:DNA-binding transcriptional LysR family regulator
MSKFNYLDVDGRLLRMFLMVYEEGSVTKAAARLDVTQSAVSHGLEKLREIVADPLFVRAGRGITATHFAEEMVEDVRTLLRELRSLSEQKGFELEAVTGQFTIAANDIFWSLLLADIFHEMENITPNLDLRIIQVGVEGGALLRDEQCDLVITPVIPEGSEFKQQKIFADEFVCFYDASVTTAPKTLDDYLSRRHARIVFSSVETNPIDQILAAQGHHRRVALQVSGFSGLAGLMKGTDLIAVLPSKIKKSIMGDFKTAPSPVPIGRLDFFQIWHSRDDDRPLHQWMRKLLRQTAQGL